ncbi:glycosyltransferase family 4 protein [Patescibacteria group bacterium]|nr:MAG: glycosyltransferase family 4 protein [Patescibacteria group bacterium]
MKILIAADLYFPVINGVATFSRNLAKGLADRGHEVLVIAPSQTGRRYKEIDGNYVVTRTISVPMPLYQNIKVSLTPMREVKKIIDEFDPDIIHIQMLMWIGQATMKYGNKIGIPIVSTNHAMPENLMDNLKLLAPVARPINYMLRDYGRRFHSKADFVTMPTQSAIGMFRVAEKMNVPMKAVSNGIDLSRFTDAPAPDSIYEKYDLPKDTPIVTYVGRTDAEKHIWALVKGFARALKTVKAHLLIVGDGSDRDNLEALVRDLGIKNSVTFAGRVPEEDLAPLHQVGKIFAMPSPMELQSIATLEAMASGKPVVAIDAGALKELCHDQKNGFLCEQDNDEQIGDAIAKILTDPELQKKFSTESLRIARENDLDFTLDQFIKIYEDLIH